MKRIASVVVLGTLAALLGGLVGAALAGFLHFVEWGQRLLWEGLTPHLPLQTLLVCTLGGLCVGLCQRYLGDYPKTMNEAVAEIQKTRRLDYSHLPQGMVTVSCSLIFGASLGPEAAIVAILGGLGTWVGDAISALRRRLNLDRSTRAANRPERLLQDWPILLALVVGSVALLHLLGGLYSGGFLNLRESFRWSDLLWSVPLSLLGAAHGILFLALQTWTKRWVAPIGHKPVLRAVLGGFALGLMSLFLPMLQFSGQRQLQQVYEQAAQLGFWVLLLIAIARLFLVNLLLASGWKGGQFLPIMFSSTALGLSVTVLFPSVPAPAAVLAVMAALLVVVLPKPLIVLALMAVMFPIQYLSISVVAVVVLMLGRRLWKEVEAKWLAETVIPTDRRLDREAANR